MLLNLSYFFTRLQKIQATKETVCMTFLCFTSYVLTPQFGFHEKNFLFQWYFISDKFFWNQNMDGFYGYVWIFLSQLMETLFWICSRIFMRYWNWTFHHQLTFYLQWIIYLTLFPLNFKYNSHEGSNSTCSSNV